MEMGSFLVVVWGFLFCCGSVLLSNVVSVSPPGNPLELHQRACSFSLVSAGNSGFILICSGNLGVPLENALQLHEGLGARVELRWRTLGNSQAAIGDTGLLLRRQGEVGILLKLKQWNQRSSRDEVGNMGSS